MMRWRKLGLVYCPDGSRPWGRTHAANPVACHAGGDRWRIYFSPRDEKNRSSISWVEIDMAEPTRIVAEAQEPVLLPGEAGNFDDSGCTIGCITAVGAKRYCYYMGWHLPADAPLRNTIGLAISDAPGEPFRRVSAWPIVPVDAIDPHTLSYPWVIVEEGRFRMWYGSDLAQRTAGDQMQHVVKYAESRDGIHWERRNHIAVGFGFPGEYALSRPCVLKDANGYRLWFSSRGESYRIRYAESDDGLTWRRVGDKAGIDVSAEGWDSEMIEYPCVFEHRGRSYLLYCGNGYGRTGFGIAVSEAAV